MIGDGEYRKEIVNERHKSPEIYADGGHEESDEGTADDHDDTAEHKRHNVREWAKGTENIMAIVGKNFKEYGADMSAYDGRAGLGDPDGKNCRSE